jgi:hypothetical protein
MHIYRPSTRNAFTALNDCKPPVEISVVYSAELNAHIAVLVTMALSRMPCPLASNAWVRASWASALTK